MVVGTANPDLQRHEEERLRAAVTHLTPLFNPAPAGYQQPQQAEPEEQNEPLPAPGVSA